MHLSKKRNYQRVSCPRLTIKHVVALAVHLEPLEAFGFPASGVVPGNSHVEQPEDKYRRQSSCSREERVLNVEAVVPVVRYYPGAD